MSNSALNKRKFKYCMTLGVGGELETVVHHYHHHHHLSSGRGVVKMRKKREKVPNFY